MLLPVLVARWALLMPLVLAVICVAMGISAIFFFIFYLNMVMQARCCLNLFQVTSS